MVGSGGYFSELRHCYKNPRLHILHIVFRTYVHATSKQYPCFTYYLALGHYTVIALVQGNMTTCICKHEAGNVTRGLIRRER